ncbi:hypothetical protein [Pseudanabaena sp. PCC 6802]|uniref:hypothetical protein n=1 Tax=Pseudanabaena sp. PCC 6802 TaxID=118173 RepID=UPI00034C2572|nr:hypothetical protein [Pseudanabaena sp. PCC 6802]
MTRKYEQLGIFAIAPITPGVAPEHKPLPPVSSCGWIERYCVVRSHREYWYWRYCYRDVNGKTWRLHVTNDRISTVSSMIAQRYAPKEIRRFIKGKLSLARCSGAS